MTGNDGFAIIYGEAFEALPLVPFRRLQDTTEKKHDYRETSEPADRPWEDVGAAITSLEP